MGYCNNYNTGNGIGKKIANFLKEYWGILLFALVMIGVGAGLWVALTYSQGTDACKYDIGRPNTCACTQDSQCKSNKCLQNQCV
jgi:hypothetical protein